MAALTFADLEIRSVFSIEKILSCHFETAENEHARLHFTAQVECRQAREEIEGMLSGQKVSLHGRGESQPVFTGVIGRAAIEDAHGSYVLKAEVLSNTCQLDLVKKSRSFQDTRMTYSQVVQSVLREYPKAGCVFKVGGEKAIGYPIIQYLETDWEFLKRLASHFNTSLFPELHTGEPKLYFGLPQRETLHQEEISHYKVRVDEKYYRMGGETLRYRKADFLHYLFESSEAYEVGDQVALKGRTLRVVRKYCRLDKDGEILYTYDVGSVRLASQLRRYNEKIAGMSLQGSVLETYGQMVKLHLDVDPQPTAAYPYCWAPATGNLMYLMPKVGTRVALYFPSGDEGEARAVTCIRTNGGQNSASMTDISRRGLVTEHDKQLQLYADRLGLIGSGQEGTPSSIILEDGKGIALESDYPISIFAKGNVNIGGKVVKFTCKTSVMAFSKGGKPVPEEGGDEIPPVAVLVIKEGNVGGYTENLPVHMVGLTYREFPSIEDAPQKGTFNWGKFALGILAGAAVVAACVFTFGVGVIAVSAAVAVTAVAVNDVYTGNVSSMNTYFKAAQAGAVVGMIGAAAGAIGGMVVGALKLGAVGTAVVSGVAGGLSAGASTLTTDAIMNSGPLALSPFGQMVSGKPMFSDGIFDKAWDNTVIFGAGGALGSYGMGMADSPVLKLLIGLASPVPFAMMGSALDDEGVSGFLPSGGGLSFDDGFGGGMGLNMLLFSGGVQLFENSPALAGAGAAGGTYGGTTAVLGGNAGAAAGNPAAAVNPAAAAGQMALYNQLAGGLAAMETLLGHLNKEEAARQQKVLEQARERFQELAEAEEKYISANIKSRAEALAAVEAMMRELDLTQSQYEAIRDALIAQNVISAAAGQAYAGTWEDLLYGDLAEYGVGYAPVLGNIYFAKKRKEAAASKADTASGGAAAGAPMPDPNGKNDNEDQKRVYEPNDGKHKGEAHGDISADPFWKNPEDAQRCLELAYSSDKTKQLYYVYKGKLIKFQTHRPGKWHAYEVINPATEVPTDVLRKMLADGLITKVQYNKWLKGK